MALSLFSIVRLVPNRSDPDKTGVVALAFDPEALAHTAHRPSLVALGMSLTACTTAGKSPRAVNVGLHCWHGSPWTINDRWSVAVLG